MASACDLAQFTARSSGTRDFMCAASERGIRIMVSVGRISALLLLLVQLLVIMDAAVVASESIADVNIYNQVGGTLHLHCKSREDDMGEKTLLDQQHLGWGFTPNFWGTTLYYCSFAWGARTQHFNVWDENHGSSLHTVFQVRKDGFWKTENGIAPFTFVVPWL